MRKLRQRGLSNLPKIPMLVNDRAWFQPRMSDCRACILPYNEIIDYALMIDHPYFTNKATQAQSS